MRSRDRPPNPYSIEDNGDGTVDVYLCPVVFRYKTDIGIDEYDVSVRVVRGVVPWPDMEADIRARYRDWCEAAKAIRL